MLGETVEKSRQINENERGIHVMKEYVIGIDGGGTHFRITAADFEGNILGRYSGPSATHRFPPDDRLEFRIREAIYECLAHFSGQIENCKALVVGTSGADSDADKAYLTSLYERIMPSDCNICIMNDAELAYEAVFQKKDGILLVAGTGSIAFGRRDGMRARSGGWVHTIMGDEGSGTWISRMALREVGRYLDGAIPASTMICDICEKCRIQIPVDLIELSTEECTRPKDVPQLGIIVNRAATQGDIRAKEILNEAARLLTGLITDCANILRLESDSFFSIGMWGSSLVKSEYLKDKFIKMTREQFPNAEIIVGIKDADIAATEIARKDIQQN